MNGKQSFILIVLLLVTVMAIAWGSRNDAVAVREDPAGTYLAFVPHLPMGERTVVLELAEGGGATMAIDEQGGAPPDVSQGTWTLRENGDLSVAFGASTTLEFIPALDTLSLRDTDVDEWSTNTLILIRAALPLETQWKWMETRHIDGTVRIPRESAMFIVRLGSDLRFTVTGDCNTISGNFSMRRGAQIVISDIVATKQFCEGSQEGEFMEDLARVMSYGVRRSALSLELSDEQGVMAFERYAGALPPQ